MSPEEKAKADEIYKAIIGKERNTLVKRYGKDAEKVAKGRAVKQAQKLAEKKMESSKDKLREMVKSALMQEKAGFTDQFDNDPALTGGQKNLPDGLQKAIISKAKGKVGEDLDLGHTDNEPHMLKSDLYHIGKYAMDLYQMVDQFEGMGEVDFPHWWQSKIIKAKEMMSSAKHYLDFETREPEIDAMVGAVDAISMNEVKNKEEDILGDLIIDMLKYKSYDEVKQTLARTLRDALNSTDINEAKLVMIDGKKVDTTTIEVSNIYSDDYPDFSDAYAANAQFMDGTELTDEQLAMLDDQYPDVVRNAAEDSLTEKKLTKPELKKREEIAKAMEKGDPKMDMEKKMAIATSIAKKVAERLKK
jgi:hypothetical protein